MSAANQLPAAMTVAEFLAWDPPDGGDRWELVDGMPRAMAPPAPRHGAIQAEAARLIGNHLADARPACRVITEAGIQPKVRANLNARVPDLAVTCANLEPDDRLLRKPEVRIDLLRRMPDGSWPDDPLPLKVGDSVTLESLGFTAPLAAFYRTAGL
jgi:Uma2 family endonuclease